MDSSRDLTLLGKFKSKHWWLGALPFLVAMGLCVVGSNYLLRYQINDYVTWASFCYPLTFLVCDSCTRKLGVSSARVMIVLGFILGVLLTGFIDVRIAAASGFAFLCAQLVDVEIFRRLSARLSSWWLPPLISSSIASAVDTPLFFGLSFYGTGVPWVTLGLGDFGVKLLVALLALLPYGLLLPYLRGRTV